MSHKIVVIVDADVIVAQANPDDTNNQKAFHVSKKLIELKAQLIYPTTTIGEATTVLQHQLGSAIAFGTATFMVSPAVQVAEVNQQTLSKALKYFSPATSKKNTLFDCIVAAVAEEYKADAIFSFDHFYKIKGFKLAEDLS